MQHRAHRSLPTLGILLYSFLAMHAAAQGTKVDSPLQEAIESLVDTNFSRVEIRGFGHAGFTFNRSDPNDQLNFGRLFDDRANGLRLNQLGFTIEQPILGNSQQFDWGFKFQFVVGTDARFTHGLGLLDNVSDHAIQPDVVESWMTCHFPILTQEGLDLKVGTFATLCGYESMDPTKNLLDSHTYIFNFGVPFKHTGALATFHASSNLDLHLGVVSGINTTFDDNNESVSFHGGVNARLLGGDVELGLAFHHGPENPTSSPAFAGIDPDDSRTIIDCVISARPFDWLTLVTDLNYGREEAALGVQGESPTWYGVAQWLIYHASPDVDLVLRAELFRDDAGFVVAQYGANDDYANTLRGKLASLHPRTIGGGPATYRSLTVGLNYRATESLRIAIEGRFDAAHGSTPFIDSTRSSQKTLAISFLFTF